MHSATTMNETFGDIFAKALNSLSNHHGFDIDENDGPKANISSFVFPLVKDVLHTSGCGGNISGFGAYDVAESEKNVRVAIDLPGVDKTNIKLEIEKHGKEYILKVSTERNVDQSWCSSGGKYERFKGKFSRVIPISAFVDQSTISAQCINGVLYVTMQKARSETSKSIPIL